MDEFNYTMRYRMTYVSQLRVNSARYTAVNLNCEVTKAEKHGLYVGRCERDRQAIYKRSIVLKNNTLRRPSLFISHLDNNAKPALRRDTNSAKHDAVPILDQHDHPIAKNFSAFYKFCRPYALVGTVIGVSSFSLFPVETMSELSLSFLVEVFKSLICAVLINIHFIGLNQVFDIEIDKINKPYLLLASGEMSLTTAKAIVVITGTMSIAMALLIQSPPLLCVVLTYFFIAGVYCIDHPFLRWKKNAFLAVFCVMAPNGLAVPIGIFMHTQKYILRKPIMFTRSFVFSTILALAFIVVIAIFKDVPDLDGDKAFGMKNFVVLFGKEKIFFFSTYLMMLAYAGAVVHGATLALLPMKIVTMLGHSGLALILWSRTQSVDLSDINSTSSFYSFLWKLHYAEYFLIHFMR